MTLVKKIKSENGYITNEVTTIEFKGIDMHLIVSALSFYNQHAYKETGNHHHADAVNELYGQMVDIYCTEPQQA